MYKMFQLESNHISDKEKRIQQKILGKYSTDININQLFALLIQLWLRNSEQSTFTRICIAQYRPNVFRKNLTANFPSGISQTSHCLCLYCLPQKALICQESFAYAFSHNSFTSFPIHQCSHVQCPL